MQKDRRMDGRTDNDLSSNNKFIWYFVYLDIRLFIVVEFNGIKFLELKMLYKKPHVSLKDQKLKKDRRTDRQTNRQTMLNYKSMIQVT